MSTASSSISPSVAVVSVTHNRRADIDSLLQQLQDIDYAQDRLTIYLVDNASTDGTVAYVRKHFPYVRLIENNLNSGIAAGFNLGIRASLTAEPRAEFVWLLDSDVQLSPGSLRPLIRAMEDDPSIGIVGSAVYDPEQRDRLVTAGLMVNWQTGEGSFVLPQSASGTKLIDVDLIPACSLMARSSLCDRLGPWDELLRLYWGDTEWCVRFKRAGYRVCCCVASRAWHRDWSSIQRGFFGPAYLHDHLRGALLFHIRHDPYHSLAGSRRLIVKSYFRAGLEQLTMRHGFSRAYEWGVRDFLAGSFASRDAATLFASPLLPNIESIHRELEGRLSTRQRWTTYGFDDPLEQAAIQSRFEEYCGPITWSVPAARKMDSRSAWSEFRVVKPRQLWKLAWDLLTPWRRADVLVTDVSAHHLSHLATARYTVFLDRQHQGVVCRNRVMHGLRQCVLLWARGVKAAYYDLPRAMRRSPALARAIDHGEIPGFTSAEATATLSTNPRLG